MALTEATIRGAKIRDKSYRIKGERGLFVEVRSSGKKVFRVRYSFQGRDSLTTFGEYPYITLDEARDMLFELRRMITNGIDPAKAPRIVAPPRPRKKSVTFEDIALEWLAKRAKEWESEKGEQVNGSRLRHYILPYIGELPPDKIEPPHILQSVIRPIESAGHLSTAHRVLGICSQIFRYAIATGRASRDPCVDLRGALVAEKRKHHPGIIDPREFGSLLRSVFAYTGGPIVRSAMKILVYTFVRSSELRKAEWSEMHLSDPASPEWRIPPERMKMKRPHIIPLSTQAVAVLEELRHMTRHGRYVFPSARSYTGDKPMSDMAINTALRAMGYERSTVTTHGFRNSASTLLHECGLWSSDAIERQLSHVDNSVRGVYNYAQYLPERRRMMQWWADRCDELRMNALDW